MEHICLNLKNFAWSDLEAQQLESTHGEFDFLCRCQFFLAGCYYIRKVVNRFQLVPRLCRFLEIATTGIEEDNDYSEGYLVTLYDNLGGDKDYLQEVCDELNLLGHLHAALVIVQRVRFVPGEQSTSATERKRPSECLPHISDKLKETIKKLGLRQPSKEEVVKALEEYKMFSSAELAEFEKEMLR